MWIAVLVAATAAGAILLIFFGLQRYFVRGIVGGAVKG